MWRLLGAGSGEQPTGPQLTAKAPIRGVLGAGHLGSAGSRAAGPEPSPRGVNGGSGGTKPSPRAASGKSTTFGGRLEISPQTTPRAVGGAGAGVGLGGGAVAVAAGVRTGAHHRESSEGGPCDLAEHACGCLLEMAQ